MSKKILWIKVTEKVSRNIGLVIDEDFSQAQADKLLQLIDETDRFGPETEEYSFLQSFLGDDISDTEGFEDVEIYIEDK